MDVSGWFSSANVYEQRKSILKNCFIGIQVIHLLQNYLYVIHLWKRDPTNDLRVIHFCLSVPEEQYVQNGLDRSLIRRSTEEYFA